MTNKKMMIGSEVKLTMMGVIFDKDFLNQETKIEAENKNGIVENIKDVRISKRDSKKVFDVRWESDEKTTEQDESTIELN